MTSSLRILARKAIAKVDRRFAEELYEESRIVFHRLEARGLLRGYAGKRILEIGPKHGLDSALLAELGPSELVLVDLPEKTPMVREWLPAVAAKAPTRHVEGNLLYLSREELAGLGRFDLVWCLGVLYHNAEQLRLIRRLRNLCADGGLVVVETHIDRSRRRIVRIYWPKPWGGVQTMTHVPSRSAVAAWMEMAGFSKVAVQPILTKLTARQRAVLTGVAADDRAYRGYATTGLNPEYVAGDAT